MWTLTCWNLALAVTPVRPPGLADEAAWMEVGEVLRFRTPPEHRLARMTVNGQSQGVDLTMELVTYQPQFKRGELESLMTEFRYDERWMLEATWTPKLGPVELWPYRWMQLIVHEATPEGMWVELRKMTRMSVGSVAEHFGIKPGFTTSIAGRSLTISDPADGYISFVWTGYSGTAQERPMLRSLALSSFETFQAKLVPAGVGTYDLQLRSSVWAPSEVVPFVRKEDRPLAVMPDVEARCGVGKMRQSSDCPPPSLTLKQFDSNGFRTLAQPNADSKAMLACLLPLKAIAGKPPAREPAPTTLVRIDVQEAQHSYALSSDGALVPFVGRGWFDATCALAFLPPDERTEADSQLDGRKGGI